ncbi:MAG: NAD(P)-binding domain-containing protein, partial [Desulfuromonadales bacterium]|nr:NAD(P)-binding domain-containing protein [Desulfuromonadales bacterium]
MKPGIALIGPGKLGCALTHLLSKAGYPIVAVIGRDRQRASEACEFIGCAGRIAGSELSSAKKAEILLLAVPDDQIP